MGSKLTRNKEEPKNEDAVAVALEEWKKQVQACALLRKELVAQEITIKEQKINIRKREEDARVFKKKYQDLMSKIKMEKVSLLQRQAVCNKLSCEFQQQINAIDSTMRKMNSGAVDKGSPK